jgi:hypothetical protein
MSAVISSENRSGQDILAIYAQGVLLPRLTTTERSALAATIGANEKGMACYDVTLGQFYTWDGASWSSGGSGSVLSGIGSPVGVVTATGPAIYLDRTNPSTPVEWVKATTGTSSTDWVLSPSGGTPANYPEVSANALRSGSTIPGVEFVVPNGSRVLSTLVDPSVALNQDIGAGDFTWWVQLSVPASLAGNAGVASLGPNNTFCLPSADNAVALLVQNGDIQLVFGNTTNNTRYGLGLSGRAGQVVDITITRSGGSLAVYIDGSLITVAGTNTGSGATPATTLNTNFAIAGGSHSSGNPNAFAGIVYRFVPFNRLLSATEVANLVRYGVDISDQWGSADPIMSPTRLNGGFETTGAGGADVFGTWLETTNGSTTINRDTVQFSQGTASLRFDVDASGSSAWVLQNSLLVTGRRYRVSVAYRHSHTASLAPQIGLGSSSVFVPFSTVAPNAWVTQTVEGIAGGDALQVFRRFTGAVAAHSQWYDALTITRIGAFLDLSFSDIYGFQAPDRSDNELDGTLIGDAAFTLPGVRSGQARWTCGANGGTQLLGQRSIPPGAAIRAVFVENIDVAGTPTFNLGTTSGGTQIINAVTIGAAGTTTQITPSAIFSSSGNLWASWSAAGDVRVTVIYDRI